MHFLLEIKKYALKDDWLFKLSPERQNMKIQFELSYQCAKESTDMRVYSAGKSLVNIEKISGGLKMKKNKGIYKKYRKFDVIYADFGNNPHGVEGGVRPAVIISCDASNHESAPQISAVPLSSKLKNIPVHVQIEPSDVRGGGLRCKSDFMPEDAQTLNKGAIRGKTGYISKDSGIREEIDRALIKQFDLLNVARKMVMEEMGKHEKVV